MPGPIRDILIDDRGNRILSSGANYSFAANLIAVGQGIRCRVSLWLGEVWYDTSLGVNYAGSILVKNPVEIVVKGELSRAISDTPDVTQVVDTGYAIDPRARAATVSFTASSPYGTVTGATTIP